MRPRPTIRLRLTGLYALLVFLAGGVLLVVSYALLDGHLHDALDDSVADAVLRDLRGQYVVALVAVTAFAVLLGWVLADRVLNRLRSIASAASTVSGESLSRRIRLEGPDDELRELANTFDEMLERLDAAFASQKRFVANASHELRTPLTVLRTEVEVALADDDATAAQLRSTVEVVRDEVIRLDALLNSLLALAKSEGRALASDDTVDLAAVTRDVVERARVAARAYGVRMSFEAHSAAVSGDPRLLEQLVFNLVDNAVSHNVRNGFAEVRVGSSGSEAVIRVSNSGPVVPADRLHLLTEPFQRFDRRRSGGGAGVGLSIVRAVAAAHGGRLELLAREGGGLEAEVALPAVRAEPRRRARRGSPRWKPARSARPSQG